MGYMWAPRVLSDNKHSLIAPREKAIPHISQVDHNKRGVCVYS